MARKAARRRRGGRRGQLSGAQMRQRKLAAQAPRRKRSIYKRARTRYRNINPAVRNAARYGTMVIGAGVVAGAASGAYNSSKFYRSRGIKLNARQHGKLIGSAARRGAKQGLTMAPSAMQAAFMRSVYHGGYRRR